MIIQSKMDKEKGLDLKDVVDSVKDIFVTTKDFVHTTKEIVHTAKDIVDTTKNIVDTTKDIFSNDEKLSGLSSTVGHSIDSITSKKPGLAPGLGSAAKLCT